jgi:DNA-binding Xre family transcriptional regulator
MLQQLRLDTRGAPMHHSGMPHKIKVSPIKKLARAKGIKTIVELSQLTGVSRQSLSAWWNGDEMNAITFDALDAICEVLEVQPGEIISRKAK